MINVFLQLCSAAWFVKKYEAGVGILLHDFICTTFLSVLFAIILFKIFLNSSKMRKSVFEYTKFLFLSTFPEEANQVRKMWWDENMQADIQKKLADHLGRTWSTIFWVFRDIRKALDKSSDYGQEEASWIIIPQKKKKKKKKRKEKKKKKKKCF